MAGAEGAAGADGADMSGLLGADGTDGAPPQATKAPSAIMAARSPTIAMFFMIVSPNEVSPKASRLAEGVSHRPRVPPDRRYMPQFHLVRQLRVELR